MASPAGNRAVGILLAGSHAPPAQRSGQIQPGVPVVSRLVGGGLHSPGRSLDHQARVHRLLTERVSKNPQFMLKAAQAFLGGALAGARANLRGEDLQAFQKRFEGGISFQIPSGPVPFPVRVKAPITVGFLSGTVVGVVQGLHAALRDVIHLVATYGGDPDQVAEDVLSVMETLVSPGAEAALRATGEQMGARLAAEARSLARASDLAFGFELGKLVGPVLVDLVVALLTGGAGAAKGIAALARRLAGMTKLRSVATRLRALGRRLRIAGRPAVRSPRSGAHPIVRPGQHGRPPTPEEAARTDPDALRSAGRPARVEGPHRETASPAGGTGAAGATQGLQPIRDVREAQRLRDLWYREGRDIQMTPDPEIYADQWRHRKGTGAPPPAYLLGEKLVYNPRVIGHPTWEVVAAGERAMIARGRGPGGRPVRQGSVRSGWRDVGRPVPPPRAQSASGRTLPPLSTNPDARPLRRIDDLLAARRFREEHVGAGGRYLERSRSAHHQEDWVLGGGTGPAPPAYVTEGGVLVYDVNALGPMPEHLLGRRPAAPR